MKKSINKTTVIIVLAIFLTLSVGYALFSDTITIEGTATAQGNFDIEATCLTEIPEDVIIAADYGIENYPSHGYKDELCTVVDDKVTYSVGLEYPSALKWYAVKFTNKGSITAKFYEEYLARFSAAIVKKYNSETNELISSEEKEYGFFNDEIGILFQKKDGTFIPIGGDLSEEELNEILDENDGVLLLKPGNSLYIFTYAFWPNRDEYTKDGLYYEAVQTVEFPFEQYNG